MEKVHVLVLGVRRYKFANENGELVKGTKVWYTDLNAKEDDDTTKGSVPNSVSLPYEAYEKFQADNLPGIYEVVFSLNINNARRPVKIVDFDFRQKSKIM